MTLLAPDPAVPRRDALLRPETMAEVISRRLLGGVPVERCERTYVKYRFGEDLRAVYRCDDTYVALRTGKHDGVAAPEAGAALYRFPHDRKLAALPGAHSVAERLLERPLTLELAAYAAEQSASFACRDAAGRVVAYAKVQRGEGERRGCEALTGHDAVRTPRVLAAADGVLLLEPLQGRRLDHAPGDSLHALGAALARLHAVPATARRFARLDPARLERAAFVVAKAVPEAAGPAGQLLRRLFERFTEAERAPVLVHGDVNLRNALALPGGRVALLDLEHLARGPAAADLGQVLANLIVARAPHRAADLLTGYGHSVPDKAALRWYTAASLLARVALPAISRYRPNTLPRLRELLTAGAELVQHHRVAA